MDRRVSILAVCVAALSAASGCQDYNFNPVGHCLIQPGTRRVTLSDVSTADVLFVVDDSGSMEAEQTALSGQFTRFLDVLVAANQDRQNNPPLQPIDFHIAVTSSAVYFNPPPTNGSVCSDVCPGASGASVCCMRNGSGGLSSPQPPACTVNADCAAGYSCLDDCQGNYGLLGKQCCQDAGLHVAQRITCSSPGEPCGDFDPFYYYNNTCRMSYVDDAAPVSSTGRTNYRYPAGKFMSFPSNPSVVHYRRDLNWAGGSSDPTITPLSADFSQNVVVGTCGSPQEQGLEAARLAVEKALAGTQPLPACPSDWTPASTFSCWPHPKSKLVVVWVTDENDGSSPYSAADGVVSITPDNSDPSEIARMYDVTRYADYFASLGRPFGAAFVASAKLESCTDGVTDPINDPTCVKCVDEKCYPEQCVPLGGCGTDPTCGGQSDPGRYFELATQLRARGADVVIGSICDTFGDTLARIGEIVKPPPGLTLPTEPAASEVTILRIARSDGTTRKTCRGPVPAAPAQYPGPPAVAPWDETNATTYLATLSADDWWFTKDANQVTSLQKLPTASSRYIYINHDTANCEANPGETYSADYLGRLPANGCTSATTCADALGGTAAQWTCEGFVPAVPPTDPPIRMGTCLCN